MNAPRRLGGQCGIHPWSRTEPLACAEHAAMLTQWRNTIRSITTYAEKTPTEVELSFPDIERIIGAMLPNSAARPQWWANELSQESRHVQRRAWQEAGYDAFPIQGEGQGALPPTDLGGEPTRQSTRSQPSFAARTYPRYTHYPQADFVCATRREGTAFFCVPSGRPETEGNSRRCRRGSERQGERGRSVRRRRKPVPIPLFGPSRWPEPLARAHEREPAEIAISTVGTRKGTGQAAMP